MSFVHADSSDAALWSLVRDGDDDAFVALYRRHWPAIARHLSRRVPACEVEDLISSVFLEAWRQRLRVTIGDDRGLLPWLYSVSRNVSAGHLDRTRRNRLAAAALASADACGDPVTDHADEISDAAEHGWRVAQAQIALASLSDADQEILDLCLTDGLAPSEAARLLGIEPVAARSRLHRARHRLAAAFAELTGEEVRNGRRS